jgi:hypothetical protein
LFLPLCWFIIYIYQLLSHPSLFLSFSCTLSIYVLLSIFICLAFSLFACFLYTFYLLFYSSL